MLRSGASSPSSTTPHCSIRMGSAGLPTWPGCCDIAAQSLEHVPKPTLRMPPTRRKGGGASESAIVSVMRSDGRVVNAVGRMGEEEACHWDGLASLQRSCGSCESLSILPMRPTTLTTAWGARWTFVATLLLGC